MNLLVFRRKILSRFTWILHPISIFTSMQVLSVTLITLWVFWFVGRQRDLQEMTDRFGSLAVPIDRSAGITVLVLGIVALVLVLVGSVMLFIWGQRQSSLIRQQRSFVSSVTHELRSPLASLHLGTETLMARALPEETRQKLLAMSLIDIDRLIRLVNQILISSRLDRGLAVFLEDVTLVDVSERLSKLIRSFRHLDPKIDQRVSVLCPPGLSFRVSANAFDLVLGNLIENALKYSPTSAPISIDVESGNGMIQFLIKDKGMGLEKRERRKIFKMFYRGSRATSKAIAGTGIGLFIVKTTLEQIGGKISVDSGGRGQGSVFKVLLPEN